jgi:hypothetical protein
MRELDLIFALSFELPVIKSEPLKSMREPVVKQKYLEMGLDSICIVRWT